MKALRNILFDTNALEYLCKLEILDIFLTNVKRAYVTDLVKKELKEYPWGDIEKYGVNVLQISGTQMKEAQVCSNEHKKLSIADGANIILSGKKNLILFTEDIKIINELERRGYKHLSLPSAVDYLAEKKIISKEYAYNLFKKISEVHLPKRYNNCNDFLDKYKPN